MNSHLKIHPSVQIHPTAVIEGDVRIDEGTIIGPLCYLRGPLEIGKNNQICAHVIIGEGPEHRGKAPFGTVRIGNNNVIRELTVIQRGTGDRDTEVGSYCYIMDHVHIAHDCLITDHVTIAPNTVLAGHVKILDGATVGISTVIHQWSVIGGYAMIGMASVVTRDVPPFCLVKGNPAKFSRLNTHAFQKLQIKESDIQVIEGQIKTDSATAIAELQKFNQYSKRNKLDLIFIDSRE